MSFRTRAAAYRDVYVCIGEGDIVYDRSTACTRDVSCEKRFPSEIENNLAEHAQG